MVLLLYNTAFYNIIFAWQKGLDVKLSLPCQNTGIWVKNLTEVKDDWH